VLLCVLPSALAAQTWERLADMPVAVAAPAVSAVGRRAVVTGGVLLGGGASDAVQVLDLDALTWSRPTTLNTARYQHAQVTLADGRVLVVGGLSRQPGHNGVPLAGCELIDLDQAVSEPTGGLPMPMRTPTLHLLGDGAVAAVGNQVVAVFDPRAGTWGVLAALHQPRRGHASVLLEDGTLLVGGGIGRSTFERVDLARGTSILMKARLPGALDDLAMVPLPGGRVWVIGGQGLDGQTTDRTWVLTVGEGSESRLDPGPRLGLGRGGGPRGDPYAGGDCGGGG